MAITVPEYCVLFLGVISLLYWFGIVLLCVWFHSLSVVGSANHSVFDHCGSFLVQVLM